MSGANWAIIASLTRDLHNSMAVAPTPLAHRHVTTRQPLGRIPHRTTSYSLVHSKTLQRCHVYVKVAYLRVDLLTSYQFGLSRILLARFNRQPLETGAAARAFAFIRVALVGFHGLMLPAGRPRLRNRGACPNEPEYSWI